MTIRRWTVPADVTSQSRNCFKDHRGRPQGRRLRDGRHRPHDLLHHRPQRTRTPILAVCGEILGDIRPAATILVVAGLYKPEMKVEIEVTAKATYRLTTLTIPQSSCSPRRLLMSPSSQIHGKISGPIVMIGFGSIRQRHPAADRNVISIMTSRAS